MNNDWHSQVKGKVVDEFTRCIHYHSPLDIIAIKFKCCGDYYPCYICHEEHADHKAKRWNRGEFDAKAILCGMCKNEMTINQYIKSQNHCPFCNAGFNPNCINHYPLYFEI